MMSMAFNALPMLIKKIVRHSINHSNIELRYAKMHAKPQNDYLLLRPPERDILRSRGTKVPPTEIEDFLDYLHHMNRKLRPK